MKTKAESTNITCNRCQHEDTWSDLTPPYIKWEWSELSQGGKSAAGIVFDLCPMCTREVKAWIKNGR